MASSLKTVSQDLVQFYQLGDDGGRTVRLHAPRVINGLVLVSGGVVAGLTYEVLCRPWDVARRTVYLEKVHSSVAHTPRHFAITVLAQKLRDDGILSFFRVVAPSHHHHNVNEAKVRRRRTHAALRTLARVGPWGAGFLVWEAFGPGIS